MSQNKPNDTNDRQKTERVWDPGENAALAQLLDHIAEELAREYVRLMEAAAKEATTSNGDDNRGEE